MKFVNKELALKLKEKGFNKPCFGYYTSFGLLLNSICEYGENVFDLMRKAPYKDCVDAPTTDQVLEWLREENYIYITIHANNHRYTECVGNYIKYSHQIQELHKDSFCGNGDSIIEFETYDDACIDAIEYVVNHLI